MIAHILHNTTSSFEKERLDTELKSYGLLGKREMLRFQCALAKLREAARTLLILDPKDPRRVFEGLAFMRRASRSDLVSNGDSVLQLTTQKLLHRLLQANLLKEGLCKSIFHD